MRRIGPAGRITCELNCAESTRVPLDRVALGSGCDSPGISNLAVRVHATRSLRFEGFALSAQSDAVGPRSPRKIGCFLFSCDRTGAPNDTFSAKAARVASLARAFKRT